MCGWNRKKHEEFVDQLSKLSRNKLVIGKYINTHTKIELACNNGHIEEYIPRDILKRDIGCRQCRLQEKLDSCISDLRCRGISLIGEYSGSRKRHHWKCVNGHTWEAIAFSVLNQGSSCPVCAKSGFDPEKPATLYYLRVVFEDKFFYKIGITNRAVFDRFSSRDLKNITIVREFYFNSGKLARDVEKHILTANKDFIIDKGTFILESGNTEIFEIDVLSLDGEIDVYK